MDYFGINSPEELPKIQEVVPEQPVEPTLILSVSEGGELVTNSDSTEE